MMLMKNHLVIMAVIISACHAGQMVRSQHPVQTTTTAVPATVPTPAATPIQRLPTMPVMSQCNEATNTTTPLGRLRSAMKDIIYTQMNTQFDAFLVFYSDEHLSEEPAPEERRLQYISNWDGVGTAVVLAEDAAIWVPGGDVRRARATVSCAWLVLDADDPSQPNISEWIIERVGRTGKIGGDMRLTSHFEWQNLVNSLQAPYQLFHVPTLVDQLWSEEMDLMKRRPEYSRKVAILHDSEYTGMSWREKVALVRNELRSNKADAMVVTALDEVAWLLNIRGKDLPYAPLLKAFVVVSLKEVRVYAPAGKLSMPVREALAVYNCYAKNNCTKVKEYSTIYEDLRRGTETKILVPVGGTFQRGASAAISQSVPLNRKLFQLSPIIYLKAQKNADEIKGMRKAHLRDAVAMCTVLSYLEGKVKSPGLTEMSVGVHVDSTRRTQAGNIGDSMVTRVAFGPNGAEPEYRANAGAVQKIFVNSTMIIHSGGQYDEGTTVVTRTLHFGTPTREMRKAYTTVLRSLAAMATLQVPATLPAAHTDPVARAPLWAQKQDYLHPTGHGVGAALNRREDPVVIDYRQDTNLHTLREGYFITSEPAWYERGKYGVRLGNVLEVVMKSDMFLGFKEATLIPFELKLIDKSLLTEYEITWLNAYNKRIRDIVGPELTAQGLQEVYYWMSNKTIHIEPPSKMKKTSNSAETWRARESIILFVGIITAYLM